MKIHINGEPREIMTARTVAELVCELGLPGPTLLIEHNGTALRRDEWVGQALGENDRIEMLRIAAGG
jgi:sulfur carrier protein